MKETSIKFCIFLIGNKTSLKNKVIKQGTKAHRKCTKEPAKYQNYSAQKLQL